MQKKLKCLLSAILWLSLISCATPPDVPVFENLEQRMSIDSVSGDLLLTPSPTCEEKISEPECGHGVFIVSKREIFCGEKKENWYNGKPWSQLKSESIYVPAEESYKPLSVYIINSCKQNNCSDEVDRFRIKDFTVVDGQ